MARVVDRDMKAVERGLPQLLRIFYPAEDEYLRTSVWFQIDGASRWGKPLHLNCGGIHEPAFVVSCDLDVAHVPIGGEFESGFDGFAIPSVWYYPSLLNHEGVEGAKVRDGAGQIDTADKQGHRQGRPIGRFT